MFIRTGFRGAWLAALAVVFTGAGWAYEYDESDATQGAGAEAAWRVEAQWDTVDETGTREIHRYTTEPRYITPIVSYIPEHSTVPSPRDVLGYIAGTEGILTRPEKTYDYFKALAAASPNVITWEEGETEEGRPIWRALISDAANIARLDELKGYTAALADPRKTTPAQAREIVAKAKPIVHITCGLHSPETGPPEMAMELAYRLAVSQHPDIVKIRENVILIITPVTDVDGRAKVVEWYDRYLKDYESREYMPSMSPPYWGNHAYHDNNRDGLQMTLRLTQTYVDSFYEWHPVYSLDLHESVPLLYVSGGTGPYNPTVDPITITEWQLFAHTEMSELQRHGLPGVWTWGFYTGWNPSYLLWVTNTHNSMGRFYETFGNLSARTMERDLSNASFAGKKITEPMWYRADPPDKKVMWSLRNNTNYMQSGVLASLKLVSNQGPMLLDNFYRKGVNSIEQGRSEKPYGWVIPAEQRDQGRLAYLINQLQKHGIEVHRANSDFKIGKDEYKAGDFIVRLDQPYGRHARNLLDVQMFPKDAEHRPYDDVSWTFGLIYRVDTKKIDDEAILKLTDTTPVTEPVRLGGAVGGGDPEVYAVKNTGLNSLITARYKLKRYDVHAAAEEFEAGGETYPAGSWLIPHKRGLRGELQQVARECMLDFAALDAMPDVPTHEVDLPKVALYHNWLSTQPDGWVRYTLNEAGVEYDYISDYTVRQGNLRRKYDVILVAHQGGMSGKSYLLGRDPQFGPQDYRPTREFPSHGFVDSARDITGGLGFEGLAELETFLNRGGTLVLMGSAGVLATDLGLLRNVSSASGVNTPGANVQTKVVRRDHPIAYGYEDVSHVFRTNGPVYSVPERFDHWVVVKYGTKPLREDEDDEEEDEESGQGVQDSAADASEADEELEEGEEKEDNKEKPKESGNFLLSGYIDGQSTLETKGAVLDVPRNAGGRVILYSFNPMHRYLNHGDFNYVYNAILHWNDFPDPEPKDHPGLAKD